VPIITLALFAWLLRSLRSGRENAPFMAALGLFGMCYLGLGISIIPMIVPYSITFWDAASSGKSQAFLMVGTLFLLPIIVMYTGWSYWVFRGKVGHGASYH
jgi:cytochrome d ubiquinol oxidase subunit II